MLLGRVVTTLLTRQRVDLSTAYQAKELSQMLWQDCKCRSSYFNKLALNPSAQKLVNLAH